MNVHPGERRVMLTARLLGRLWVVVDGQVVDTVSSRRTRNVLAYLLTHRETPVPRDVLMDVFWGNAAPGAARNSVHVALSGVRRALRAGYRLRSILVDEKRVEQFADLPDDATVYAGAPDVLEAITGFHVHRGVLGSFHRRDLPSVGELIGSARRLAVLEGLNTHTNLGALFRSAAALGIDAILLSPNCADPLYRRAVRVSMGEVFAIPYAKAEAWPEALKVVRDAGFRLLALTPGADSVNLQELSVADRERPALAVVLHGRIVFQTLRRPRGRDCRVARDRRQRMGRHHRRARPGGPRRRGRARCSRWWRIWAGRRRLAPTSPRPSCSSS